VIEALAFCAHRTPADLVAYRGSQPVTLAQFLADMRRTALRLPAGGYVLNLCGDRYRFAVALGAALVRGVVTLLPPSTAPHALARIAGQYNAALALVDSGLDAGGLRTVNVEVDASAADAQEVPAFDPAQLAVVVFTSGSTGAPQPQPKTWGSLVQGAAAEVGALGMRALGAPVLVGTVPPQHMYGLESTVLLALRNGFAFHAARPLYPADVCAALSEVPAPRVLVTTPVHLRALLEADVALPPLALLVCATAPLSPALAQQAERRFNAPLQEIYGCTEAGMLAMRRPVAGSAWRTLPGIEVSERDGAAWFSGGHVQRPVAAPDRIAVRDAHSFDLHGRSADLVNVGGKRTSLAGLERALGGVEGVQDCAFLIPEERDDRMVTRLVAFAVAPGCSREQLLAALRDEVDAVFLPRPLYLVEALPRNATGKLTRDALLALAARCAAAGTAVLVQRTEAVALAHFPGDPVVPGALMLDEVLRRAEARLHLPPSAWDVCSAKFLAPLRPGEALRVEFQQDRDGTLRFACVSGARTVAAGAVRLRSPA
jgi:acyl-coenzyme A synthetase/AMP-(fatty) acid ligase